MAESGFEDEASEDSFHISHIPLQMLKHLPWKKQTANFRRIGCQWPAQRLLTANALTPAPAQPIGPGKAMVTHTLRG
jgi:hypothetical protein